MAHLSRIIVVAALALITGCGDKPAGTTAPVTPPPPANTVNLGQPKSETPVVAAPAPSEASAQSGAPSSQPKLGPTGNEFEEVSKDPSGDPQVVALQTAVESFHAAMNRYPASWQELVKEGYYRSVPTAPSGKKYMLDSKTGTVSSVDAK